MLRILLTAVAAACALLLGIGFAGAAHPAADSLAVIRLPLAVLLALLALSLRRSWAAYGGLMLAGAAVASAAVFMVPAAAKPGGPVATIYQKNLLYREADRAALIADIRAAAPQAVMLQEVSRANQAVMQALADLLPYQHYCPFAAVGGTAVLTAWPIAEGGRICADAGGLAAVQAETPAGPVWLVSLHLHWPWPYRQADHAAALLPVIGTMEGPVILAGDFNMVPWSHRFSSFLEAARGQAAGPSRVTLWKRGLPLPIDHVIAPGGGTAAARPPFSSDHMGVLAEVRLLP